MVWQPYGNRRHQKSPLVVRLCFCTSVRYRRRSKLAEYRNAEMGVQHRISSQYTSISTQTRWLGAKIVAVGRTDCITAASSEPHSAAQNPKSGAAIGNGVRHDG
jgi:hypothetical protein